MFTNYQKKKTFTTTKNKHFFSVSMNQHTPTTPSPSNIENKLKTNQSKNSKTLRMSKFLRIHIEKNLKKN